MDGGAWWAAVHGVAKSRTRRNDFTFTFHFHALEKEMEAHPSILAWRIPGMGGAWWAAVYGVTQSRTQLKRLSCSSSMIRDVEHLFIYLLTIRMFSLGKISITKLSIFVYIKLQKQNFTAKETINKMKKQPMEWEKICLSHISNMGLIQNTQDTHATQ